MTIDDEIALLARQLQGALEVAKLSGIESLPRPQFVGAVAASATAAVATTASSPPPRTDQDRAPKRSGPETLAGSVEPVSVAKPNLSGARAGESERSRGLAIVDSTSAPAPAPVPVPDQRNAAERLSTLCNDTIGDCKRCKLHRGRNKLVFGVGNPEADIVFVGEGPGADEDRQGVPFVGRAGQLLTKMIEAMGRKRDDVYICNVVKCRPPNNRDPEPDEVESCEPFLRAQLEIIQPKVIVTLGKYAAQTLLRSKTPISKLRGTWREYEGIPLMPTYHPSYLLREEEDPDKKRKREAWSDLKQVMAAFAVPRQNGP